MIVISKYVVLITGANNFSSGCRYIFYRHFCLILSSHFTLIFLMKCLILNFLLFCHLFSYSLLLFVHVLVILISQIMSFFKLFFIAIVEFTDNFLIFLGIYCKISALSFCVFTSLPFLEHLLSLFYTDKGLVFHFKFLNVLIILFIAVFKFNCLIRTCFS